MGRRFPAFLIGLLSFLATALGESPAPGSDPIADKLEEAKKVYKQDVETAKKIIMKALDEADEMARDAADVDLVKSIKAERAEFEVTGKPPKHFASTEYTKQRETIRKVMFDAYTMAIRDYLKARKDDKAEKVKEERDEFQRDKPGGGQGNHAASPQSEFGVARFGAGSEQINDVAVKTGDPQFTLIWDSTVDLDLHVFEPGGKEIFWNDRLGKVGGVLDVDNVDGFGPENIYWPTAGPHPAPTGEYKWLVQYYGGNRGIPLKTNWKVRVKHDGKVSIYSGILTVPGARSKSYTLQVEQPQAVR